MKGKRGWLVLGAIFAVASALILAQTGNGQDSPEHRSSSDGPNGTSALSQYAAALGHPVRSVDFGFILPDPPATLFVFNPSPYSAAETRTLDGWVRAGGTLIYADDALDTRLALAFNLHRGNPVPGDGTVDSGPPRREPCRRRLPRRAVSRRPTRPSSSATRREARRLPSRRSWARAGVIALGAPEMICNGWLEKADNGLLAAGLISMTPGPVAFDEFHHGAAGAGRATGRHSRSASDSPGPRSPSSSACCYEAGPLGRGSCSREGNCRRRSTRWLSGICSARRAGAALP